mmetsp:Transcript_21969/g.36391  ORF Transcript_21969/g.36391 Transcript_21969/m.36391 type:complete len:114 (+) Transcript_21969:117-458(+)
MTMMMATVPRPRLPLVWVAEEGTVVLPKDRLLVLERQRQGACGNQQKNQSNQILMMRVMMPATFVRKVEIWLSARYQPAQTGFIVIVCPVDMVVPLRIQSARTMSVTSPLHQS